MSLSTGAYAEASGLSAKMDGWAAGFSDSGSAVGSSDPQYPFLKTESSSLGMRLPTAGFNGRCVLADALVGADRDFFECSTAVAAGGLGDMGSFNSSYFGGASIAYTYYEMDGTENSSIAASSCSASGACVRNVPCA